MENRDTAIEKAKELLESNAYTGLKEEIRRWFSSFGTDDEDFETGKLIEELEADIIPIEGAIWFFGSDKAKEMFGEAKRTELLMRAKSRKEAGEKYCDCPACTMALELLELLKTDNKTL